MNLKNGRPFLKGPQELLIDAWPGHLARVIELGVAGPAHHLHRQVLEGKKKLPIEYASRGRGQHIMARVASGRIQKDLRQADYASMYDQVT